jgi:outer membrane protein OmpA-like peptidoglycan-associated protein
MTRIKFSPGSPLAVAIGRAHTVEIPPRVFRGRLTGFLFETAKTFLLPSAMNGIRGLKSFYDEHPGLAVLVTGHTDTVGPAEGNRVLSVERADSIAAFLQDDVDAWLDNYSFKPHSEPWGTREDQHMLSTVLDGSGQPFYTGPIDGAAGPDTKDAIARFQAANGLAADRVAGPNTRRALVTAYMALQDTTLPAGTQLQTHGCGKFHLAVPTDDNVDEPRNRRVEIFFFEGPIDPPPESPCPDPGCPDYPEWVRRTILTVDFDLPSPVLSNARWEAEDPPDTRDVTLTVLDLRRQPLVDRDVTVMMVGQDNRIWAHTDGSGQISIAVPKPVTQLKLRYAPDDSATLLEVAVALDVPPISDDAGVVARLENLGYPASSSRDFALYMFQRDFGLVPPSCAIDDPTRQKLLQVHGS